MRITTLFALLGMIVGVAARSQAEGDTVEGTWAGFIVDDPKATIIMTFEKDRTYTYVQLLGEVAPRKGDIPELPTSIAYHGNFIVHGYVLKLERVIGGKKSESEFQFKVEGAVIFLSDGKKELVLLKAREGG